jgi:hypothetical protein
MQVFCKSAHQTDPVTEFQIDYLDGGVGLSLALNAAHDADYDASRCMHKVEVVYASSIMMQWDRQMLHCRM